jgi:tRNA A-37 threonylcarbamoyl transferase component Bud32
MSPELHQRVRKLFDEAIEKPEGQRLAFLKAACTNDLETYQGVVRLLESMTSGGTLLQSPTRPLERMGRYLLSGELGRGAMGVVYEAMDPLIGRSVAVKIINLQFHAGSKEAEFMRDRLFREARAAGRLFHPGIVVILDVGQDGDTAFIAMERVDGPTLEKTLASGRRLKVDEALDILRQTAAALDYAHQNSVVHRDVKPANIMLHKGTTVKVADFGIAKSMSTEHGTVAGMIMGTPSYMSPEQIEAQPVDGRSDQFSLAVVAYELLSGNRPFKGDSLATLAHTIVYGDRPSIRRANPALPPVLDEVLHRGLARNPGQRYESCTQFVTALEQALAQVGDPELLVETRMVALPEEPSVQEPVAAIAPPIPKKRRSKTLGYVAAAGAALIILDVGLFYYRAAHPPHRVPVVSDDKTTVAQTGPPAGQTTAPSPSLVTPPEVKAPPAESPAASPPAEPTPAAVAPATAARVDKQTQAGKFYGAAVEQRNAGRSAEAMTLLRKAADLGDSRAMQELGEMYMEGAVVDKNDEEAAKWFRKGADKGNTAAMLYLGVMYQLGNGVEQSETDAANWFRKAADAGNSAAMYNLGTLYEAGTGVPRDAKAARALYEKAAKLGDQEAQKRLREMH